MRTYKRKTARGASADILRRAAEKVKDGDTIRKVARDFSVDRMTLTRFIKKTMNNPQATTGYKAVAERKQIFSDLQEHQLAEHIKELSNMFHGLCLKQVMQLAFQLADKNGLDIPNSWTERNQAGRNWWLGFKSRHNLSIRAPEATSFYRASAFNRPVVDMFFTNLALVLDKYKFEAKDIFNVDETGCTTVQKPTAIVTQRGKKQIGAITSAERGELVTVTYAISAAGNVVPPMFIFPRVNYREHFIRGSPPGSFGRATKSGWMNVNLFGEYLDHLIRHIRPSVENRILLVMDNHESHVSLTAVDKARDNGIVIVTIPPHTSHRLQPLDKAVYGPFKSAYNRAADDWLKSHPGQTLTIYDIPHLVHQAHLTAMCPRNIISGFRSTGIYPLNRDIFSEDDFAAASTTDRELPIEVSNSEPALHQPQLDSAQKPAGSHQQQTVSSPQPGTSRESETKLTLPRTETHQSEARPQSSEPVPQTPQVDATRSVSVNDGTELVSQPTKPGNIEADIQPINPGNQKTHQAIHNPPTVVSPRDIHPLPRAPPRKQTRNTSKKRHRSQILTDTPNRNELQEEQNQKQIKLSKVAKKSLFTDNAGPESPSETGTSDSSDYSVEETDGDSDFEEHEDIIEGDFVIVKVAGKSRVVNYIARVDVADGSGEFEGVFLRKLSSKQGSDKAIFVADPNDEALFPQSDIMCKLPQPTIVGGSARRSTQLAFSGNLSKWNI